MPGSPTVEILGRWCYTPAERSGGVRGGAVMRSALTVLLISMALVQAGPSHPTDAGPQAWFVRVDGDDAICNGWADLAAPGQDGYCAFRTIGKALAASHDGDWITVGPGTYATDTLTVSKQLTIQGRPGSDRPAIYPDAGSFRLIECTGVGGCSLAHLRLFESTANDVVTLTTGGSIDDTEVVGNGASNTFGITAMGAYTVSIARVDVHGFRRGVFMYSGAHGTIVGGTFTKNDIALRVATPAAGTSIDITANTITDNNYPISVSDPGDGSVRAAFNRLSSNKFAVDVYGTAHLVATMNWWGSNDGPVACETGAECVPWLVLRPPVPVLTNKPVRVSFDMTRDSDGNDVAGIGDVPLPDVVFGASSPSLGTITPGSTPFVGGEASTMFSPTTLDGTATITATLDDETVVAVVNVDVSKPARTIEAPAFSRQRAIPITLSGSDPQGVTGYYVSESRMQPSLSMFTPTPPATFTLSDRDGRHRVFAWTRDAAGNISGAPLVSDITILDRKKPASRVEFPANGSTVAQLSNLSGAASDPVPRSGIAGVSVALRRQQGLNCFFWSGKAWVGRGCRSYLWLKASGARNWARALPASNPALDPEGEYSVFTRVTDRAGNVGAGPWVLGENWVRFRVEH